MVKLTKKLADKLMNVEGEARGMHFWSDAYYVREQEGEEGVRKVEAKLSEVGHPIDFGSMKRMEFYPLGYRSLSLVAIQDALDWGDEEIRNLCGYAAGSSLIVRLYMKYFYSLDKVAEKAPEIWDEYFSSGELTVPEYSEKDRYAVVEIRESNLHPVFCQCLYGYFKSFIKMVVKADEVQVEERKCVSKGDDFHEFLLTW